MAYHDSEHDSELYMTDATTRDDAVDFVEARLREPVITGDVVVWDFHNASIETQPFLDWVAEAGPGPYVIPYQIPGVWAYMAKVLPRVVSNARLVAYRKGEGEYVDYENWLTATGRDISEDRDQLEAAIEEIAGSLPEEVAVHV